jgi:hypothetical protein
MGDMLRVDDFKHNFPQFKFIRRKNVVLIVDVDKTDEADLHAAMSFAARKLERLGASCWSTPVGWTRRPFLRGAMSCNGSYA